MPQFKLFKFKKIMKKNNLIFVFALSIFFLFACNAKKEKNINGDGNVNKNNLTQDDYEKFTNPDTVSAITDKEVKKQTEIFDTDEKTESNSVTQKSEKKEPVMQEKEDGSLSRVSDDELKKAEKTSKKTHVKKFYVIAGSFQNIENATDLRTYLKTKNFPAMVLYPYRGYNRVAVNSFKTRKEAEKAIAKVRKMKLNYKKETLTYWLLWR